MKSNVSLLLILICLLTPRVAASTTNTSISFSDSLRQVVSQIEGMDKIALWRHIILQYTNNGETDKARTAIALLSEDADKLGDPTAISQAKIQLLTYYYNQHEIDSLEMFAPAYLDYFEKHGKLDMYFRLCEIRIILAGASKNSKMGEDLIQEMYDKAQELNYPEGIGTALKHLGNLYITMYRFDEAEESFREALDILKTSKQPGVCNEVYMLYTNMLLSAERYDDSLALLNEQEPYLHQTDSICTAMGMPGAATAFYFYMHRGFFHTYVHLKNAPMARHYLKLMQASPLSKGGGLYIPIELKIATIELYTLEKRYPEALAISDSLLDLVKQMNEPGGINNILRRQQRIYLGMGNAEELYRVVTELEAHNDSIQTLEYNAKLDELRTIYEVDKIKLEKEKQRIYTLAAMGGCALLLAILILSVVYARRLRQKNLALYRQIQATRAAEVAEAASHCPQVSTVNEPLSREAELFRAITELMQKDHLFIRPDLDRKSLAETMGTNEKYIADAIREGTGETVLAYISRLRLQHALLLFDKHPEFSLEAIAEESGHSSYSSFYRTFTKVYGMNPSEYKKLASKAS